MNTRLLACFAALSLSLAFGCGPSQAPETQESQAQELDSCAKGQYLCTSCDGLSTYCGDACLDCDPPAAPTGEVEEAATTCREGTQLCTRCDGTGTYCAIRCFLCAEQ